MKVLLIKTSSLGDVIHALPAVTEAASRLSDLELTWVVEESFADLVEMHPAVTRVIPVATRRWRKSWIRSWPEVLSFLSELKDTRYDLVVDSQGLIKSAAIAFFARGNVHGFEPGSAREPLAARFYTFQHKVDSASHAVNRQKQLLAASLSYQMKPEVIYGLGRSNKTRDDILFVPSTTWPSKEWPLSCWQELADHVVEEGFRLLVPAGRKSEGLTARAILGNRPGEVLADRSLGELAHIMSSCAGAVTVDTGLGHLAVALNLPVVGLYGSTDPELTGLTGGDARLIVSNHLQCIPCKRRVCHFPNSSDSSKIYPPCFSQSTPERVWRALQLQIGKRDIKLG